MVLHLFFFLRVCFRQNNDKRQSQWIGVGVFVFFSVLFYNATFELRCRHLTRFEQQPNTLKWKVKVCNVRGVLNVKSRPKWPRIGRPVGWVLGVCVCVCLRFGLKPFSKITFFVYILLYGNLNKNHFAASFSSWWRCATSGYFACFDFCFFAFL